MGFPDRIERIVELAASPGQVWAALTTAEGLGAWFGHEATIDLRPGGTARMRWADGPTVDMRIERVEEPTVFGFTWPVYGLPEDDPRRTYVEFTLEAGRGGHAANRGRERLCPAARGRLPHCVRRQQRGLGEGAGRTRRLPRCRLTLRRSPSRSLPPWPTRPARHLGRAGLSGPGHRHGHGRLPITRQAIAKHLALLAKAGLVTAEPGERRRVRYRLRSAPMQVAQQFLAALARDWDGPLHALRDHLDQHARGPA